MFSSGVMFGAGASQDIGMGGTQFGATQFGGTQFEAAGAEGAVKKRQEVKETCLPVTLRAVELALEQRGETGEDLKFYGIAEPSMVLVVAAVESVVRQAASLELVLNDATGRMKARYFVTDRQPELERIAPGGYVSCFGEVRSAPVRHLALKGVRPIDSADDVSYHMIEAAHAMLQLQRGKAKTEPSTPAKKSPEERLEAAAPAKVPDFTPEKPPASAAPAATPLAPQVTAAAVVPVATKAPTGADVRAAVLRVLRDGDVGPEGLPVDGIAQKVGAAAAEIKAMVAELVDDGEIYNTITDEHFAAV